MDAAEETPQLVCQEKRPRVDGEALGHSPTQAVSVAKVLDDDDLLREIIVRVGFPTTLIRAALVCKRWLEHASDPKFLSPFHKLHPPRLLGYYITEEPILSDDLDTTHFVPMLPQAPELSDIIRNLESYNFRSHKITCPRLYPIGVHFGHNKIYLPSTSGEIIILDLMALSYSTIQLPQGVKEYRYLKSLLSRADDAFSVYLIHCKGFQLQIWLHKGDNWLLLDTICLREMLSTLGMSGHMLENDGFARVLIRHVGDNAQSVMLQMGDCIFYLDIKCRTLSKVYENTLNDRDIRSVHPFMMIWPPTFPALKDDPARNAM